MTTQTPTFDTFAIIELFGHARIAGRVSEQVIAGAGMLRVDVPELPETKYHPAQPAYTRFFGSGAIYSITPVDEVIANQVAQQLRVKPVNVYFEMPQLRSGNQDDDHDEDDFDQDDPDDSNDPGF